ncbi:hypothetical protein M885DRAFT_621039 [Pelagophyceae sp. CCMP2097]|nr:hypothetical protein M885DRAFT_621039 [Pelagophyceae sp. CCMP2097]
MGVSARARGARARARPGSCALWLKRNWLLMCLCAVAFAGVVLSVLLLFKPSPDAAAAGGRAEDPVCAAAPTGPEPRAAGNETTFENASVVRNVTTNVTVPFNTTLARNVTRESAASHRAAPRTTFRLGNVTREVTRKVTREVTTNETVVVNVTTVTNVTVNGTVFFTTNTTVNTTVTNSVTRRLPVDVVVACDSSGSVSDGNWRKENEAGRALLTAFLAAGGAGSAMQAGMARFSSVADVPFPLAAVEALEISKMDAQRLPACVAVPWHNAWNSDACARVYGYPPNSALAITSFSFYGQALIACANEFAARGAAGAYRLCEVITDGALTEDADGWDSYTYGVDTAGALSAVVVQSRGDLPPVASGVYDFCFKAGLLSADGRCAVTAVAQHMKHELNISIYNILVGNTTFPLDVQQRMYALSSCTVTPEALGDGTRCAYVSLQPDFDALTRAAITLAGRVAETVGTTTTIVQVTSQTTYSKTTSRKVPMRSQTQVTSQQEVVNAVTATVTTRTTSQETAAETLVVAELVAGTTVTSVVEPSMVTVTTATSMATTVRSDVVTRENVCAGSGASFALLLLCLPLAAYLLAKPLTTAVARCRAPPDDDSDDSDAVFMTPNPAFGLDSKVDAADAAPRPRAAGAVDMTLAKKKHVKTKKFGNVGGDADVDADFDGAAPAARGHAAKGTTEVNGPKGPISDVERAPRARRSLGAAPAARARDSVNWGHGLAQVYDGDDWQEAVADAVIGAVLCRRCRRQGRISAADTGQLSAAERL